MELDRPDAPRDVERERPAAELDARLDLVMGSE
jgi:hypothetical protein